MHHVMQQHQCPLWRYLIHLDGVVILTPRHDVNGMNDAAPPINSSFKVLKKIAPSIQFHVVHLYASPDAMHVSSMPAG